MNTKRLALRLMECKRKKMPKKKNRKSFANYHEQLPAPSVICADFECLTVPISEKHGNNTEAYQEHKACGYGYNVVCSYDGKYSKPTKIYRRPGAVHKLIENLLEEEKDLRKIIKKNEFKKEMIITKDEETRFTKEDVPVRDHCHVTGKYRGSAHNTCNRSFRLFNKIPIIFHNLKEYDGYLIMQETRKFNKSINVIPNNMERYMAFMISYLVFIDSFQFMSSNLSNLANNLSKESFHHAKNNLIE